MKTLALSSLGFGRRPSLARARWWRTLTSVALALAIAPLAARSASAQSTPPTSLDFHGGAGFGYTDVYLFMHFDLIGARPSLGAYGGIYQVSGLVTVDPLGQQPTVLDVSGIYDPSLVPAAFAVDGAPAGNNPVLTSTRIGSGTLDCQLTGIPSLGIYSLYISAQTMPETLALDTANTDAVSNGGSPLSFYLNTGDAFSVQRLFTYNWNNGAGASPGFIGLEDGSGAVTWWRAMGTPGQFGVPNVNWDVSGPLDTNGLPYILRWDMGPYTVFQWPPSTWSQNSQSQGLGFTKIWVE